jgi:hypothetical protein
MDSVRRIASLRSWIIVLVFLFGFPSYAADLPQLQKNPVDLRTTTFFARPLTELEVILINLKSAAEKIGSFIGDDKSLKFLPDRSPDTDVGFDPKSGRIILFLELAVSEMSDPWKKVCDNEIVSYHELFYFPDDKFDSDLKVRLLRKYFGEAIRLDATNAKEAANQFLASLVARVVFTVASADKKQLKWLRTCTKDYLTGKTDYTEYRYPGVD